MKPAAIRIGMVTAALVVAMLPMAGPATAGGGCHSGMTQGSGDTVRMVKACFTPSIVRIDPGGEVTFVNEDPLGHNVSANGWGEYADMLHGDAFTAEFAEPGIYPFACTYHPGMIGAVVVGDGTGPGSGEVVNVAPVDLEDDTAATGTTSTVRTEAPDAAGPFPWLLAGAGGLVIGAGLGFVLRRKGTATAS